MGIGTTTPASNLDIEGGVSIGATYSGTTAAPTNGAIIQGQVGIGTNAPNSVFNVELLNSNNFPRGFTSNNTLTTTSANYSYAIGANMDITPQSDVATAHSANIVLTNRGSQNITSTTLGLMGLNMTCNNSSTGTLTNWTGNWINVNNSSTGTVTSLNCNWIRPSTNASGTVTNWYGMRIDNQTITTTLTAAYHSAISAATNRYNLYMVGTAQNYLEGSVGIGTNSPDEKLEVTDGNILLTDNYALNWGNPSIPRGSLRTFSNSPYRGMRYYARCQGVGWEGVHDFYTQIDTATDVLSMRIVNGRVGLGTSSPGGTLSIVSSNTTGATTSSSLNLTANSLTTGCGIYGTSSSLTNGSFANMQVSGTAATSGQRVLNIATSGANSTSSVTTYGAVIANTHSGTSSTNTALFLSASGGTTNNALVTDLGNVGIGTATPGTKLEVAGQVKITGGSPGSGKVLTSDANGLATWNDGVANSTITNDASTNATMYPVWVTANSGSLPLKVSSTKLSFNPSTGKLTATGDATINTLTVGLGNSGVAANTAFGYQVLSVNSSGTDNAYVGYQAGKANTTGSSNTGVGNQALLSNTSAVRNTAVGAFSMYSSTTGDANTALGFKTLFSNTTGYYNIAIGHEALIANTTGAENVVAGYGAMAFCTTANNNTAIGTATLRDNTGNNNTATGYYALRFCTSGANNTAAGTVALYSNGTGGNNTAVGYRALYSNTTGSNNTSIGYDADVSANNYSNATAIGYGAVATGSNYVKIGNSSVGTIGGQVGWTTISDGRFKTNISESDVKGLDFIMALRPVVYNFDTRLYEEFLTKNMSDSIRTKRFEGRDFSASTAVRQSGFIAQEVAQAADKVGYNFNGVHKPESENDNYGLTYGHFVVPLVKALQEQQQQIQAKEAAITNLQAQVNQLLQRLDQLERK